jgi:hypothetical protein
MCHHTSAIKFDISESSPASLCLLHSFLSELHASLGKEIAELHGMLFSCILSHVWNTISNKCYEPGKICYVPFVCVCDEPFLRALLRFNFSLCLK